MFSLKHMEPPAQFSPQGIGEYVIGVRLLVLTEPGTQLLLPESNRTGTNILGRLLQARMEAAGVCVIKSLWSFDLNRSFYWFRVSEIAAAQETVKKELAELRLLQWVQIAWYDPREGVWRACHSKTGRFEVPTEEELAADMEFISSVITALEQCQQSKDEPAGQ